MTLPRESVSTASGGVLVVVVVARGFAMEKLVFDIPPSKNRSTSPGPPPLAGFKQNRAGDVRVGVYRGIAGGDQAHNVLVGRVCFSEGDRRERERTGNGEKKSGSEVGGT